MGSKSFSKIKRAEILSKTEGACYYCGIELDTDTWHNPDSYNVDHVLPMDKGGDHFIDNLVPSCRRCNNCKKNLSLEEFRRKYVRIYKMQIPYFSIEQMIWLKENGNVDLFEEIERTAKTHEFFFESGLMARIMGELR